MGTDGPDVIVGGPGNDRLFGGGGNDSIEGGPDLLRGDGGDLSCVAKNWNEDSLNRFGTLAAGAVRTHQFTMDCTGGGGENTFTAAVSAHARDTNSGNDEDEGVTIFE